LRPPGHSAQFFLRRPFSYRLRLTKIPLFNLPRTLKKVFYPFLAQNSPHIVQPSVISIFRPFRKRRALGGSRASSISLSFF
jgi:hypothetical protein